MDTKPIKYHGGKSYLAKQIISCMPPHTRYCEPYFGGGAVLFEKPCEGVSEFVNDIDEELANFWRVLRSTPDRMLRSLWATPLSFEVWDTATKIKADEDGVRRATSFFIRYRQSRQGLGEDFCTPTSRTRRGMNENVSAWLSAVECLPEAHERLKRVEIRCQEATSFIRELDSPETLHYCDPPYLHETRSRGCRDSYSHEMTEEQHKALLFELAQCKGKFILSGYPSELYERWRASMGFWRVDIEIDNKASSSKKKAKKTECLWMNFEPAKETVA